MRKRLFLILSAIMSVTVLAQDSGVAVVELFSSEGCSSCPSADQVLKHIHERAQQNDQPVYTLAFQVDYWNRLGWMDRFSSPAFTKRQNDYAQHLRLDSLYTPQMIVNGRTEFVGSDSAQADAAIAAARRQPAAVKVTPRVTNDLKNKVTVDFDYTGVAPGDMVNVAIVEDGLASTVTRGENSGRQLQHSSVVRSFLTRPITNDHHDSVTVDLGSIDAKKASAVVYIQDGSTFAVRGAAAVKFP